MTLLADPIEDRDPWRALWRSLTSDALLIALCAIAAVGLLTMVILPQQPMAGMSDPVAYSRWEASAKQRLGTLYEPLDSLGLNDVADAIWWRIALAALIPVAGLRLTDRLARLIQGRRGAQDGALRDERRAHVTMNAPALNDLAGRLRDRRYRVLWAGDEALVADRAPWAEAASALLHFGLVLAAVGLSFNLVAGWEAMNRTVAAGAPTPLRDGYAITLDDSASSPARVVVVLQPGDASAALAQGDQARLAGLDVALRQIIPGYRLSATTLDARPLLIRASNFVSPTSELLVTFGADEPERYIALPEAQLALALTAEDFAGQSVRLRAFAIPSGNLITDTAAQPTLVIGNVQLRFALAQGAIIDARYAPGDLLWRLGLAMALIGAVGGLIYPMRRILIFRRGGWTEFYASGRSSRREVARLVQSPPEADS